MIVGCLPEAVALLKIFCILRLNELKIDFSE